MCGQFFGQDQKFQQRKGFTKNDILAIRLNPIIDYIRNNLDEIKLRELSGIIYGVAFVYHFQK